MSYDGYLMIGTAVVWFGTFLYVLGLIRKQKQTEQTIQELRLMLEEDANESI